MWDAMIGQESVSIAQAFEERIGMDGFVMTKLDGDARGGAALSIVRMTGKPIKLACIGEKVDDIEEFIPDRMASRILGMGDVLTLIEKASENLDEDSARRTMDNLRKNQFTMEDMLSQFEQVRKMGSIQDVLGMIPGVGGKKLAQADVDESLIDRNMGDHPLHDTKGADQTGPFEREPQKTDRCRIGYAGPGCQPAGQPVQGNADNLMKRFAGKGKGRRKSRMGFPF